MVCFFKNAYFFGSISDAALIQPSLRAGKQHLVAGFFEVFLVKLSFKCAKTGSFLAASMSILMPKYGISAPLPYKLATCFHPYMHKLMQVPKRKCVLDAV